MCYNVCNLQKRCNSLWRSAHSSTRSVCRWLCSSHSGLSSSSLVQPVFTIEKENHCNLQQKIFLNIKKRQKSQHNYKAWWIILLLHILECILYIYPWTLWTQLHLQHVSFCQGFWHHARRQRNATLHCPCTFPWLKKKLVIIKLWKVCQSYKMTHWLIFLLAFLLATFARTNIL